MYPQFLTFFDEIDISIQNFQVEFIRCIFYITTNENIKIQLVSNFLCFLKIRKMKYITKIETNLLELQIFWAYKNGPIIFFFQSNMNLTLSGLMWKAKQKGNNNLELIPKKKK